MYLQCSLCMSTKTLLGSTPKSAPRRTSSHNFTTYKSMPKLLRNPVRKRAHTDIHIHVNALATHNLLTSRTSESSGSWSVRRAADKISIAVAYFVYLASSNQCIGWRQELRWKEECTCRWTINCRRRQREYDLRFLCFSCWTSLFYGYVAWYMVKIRRGRAWFYSCNPRNRFVIAEPPWSLRFQTANTR